MPVVPDAAGTQGRGGYHEALRMTLRNTAAAYGYTLTISMTTATLASVHGLPRALEVVLFAVGGLLAFAVLEALLQLFPDDEGGTPREPFAFAGALNVVAVAGGLGAAGVLAHVMGATPAWLLAPLAATAAYMLLVAAQITVVNALRG